MIRPVTLIAIILLGCCAYGLFQVKYRVQTLKRDLTEFNRQLDLEKDAIHVLRAEWAYLNQPDRLRVLAQKYLSLTPIQVTQLREIKQLDRDITLLANAHKAVKQPSEKYTEKTNSQSASVQVAQKEPKTVSEVEKIEAFLAEESCEKKKVVALNEGRARSRLAEPVTQKPFSYPVATKEGEPTIIKASATKTVPKIAPTMGFLRVPQKSSREDTPTLSEDQDLEEALNALDDTR